MVCVKELARKKRRNGMIALVGSIGGIILTAIYILWYAGAFAYSASSKIKDIDDLKTSLKEVRAELKELSTTSNKTAQDVAMIKGYIFKNQVSYKFNDLTQNPN